MAGLSCGARLHAAGVRVRILEAADGVGGRVRTDAVDGFLLDRGFQIFLTSYPEAAALLDYGALDLQPFYAGALKLLAVPNCFVLLCGSCCSMSLFWLVLGAGNYSKAGSGNSGCQLCRKSGGCVCVYMCVCVCVCMVVWLCMCVCRRAGCSSTPLYACQCQEEICISNKRQHGGQESVAVRCVLT